MTLRRYLLAQTLCGAALIRRAFAAEPMLLDAGVRSDPVPRWLPRSIPLRSIVVAVLCTVAFTLPLSLVLPMSGVLAR
ncbi:hypothetical protein CEW88_19005 [Alloyangia pacifica]|uniref:Uncharacterized protein n=1 Tax=Alloyangia pacifica TaxID=311180 RepID=A0A2U8HJ07_9RHOB|nr:hypothetical protein [Alloyangia pacifica]AWI85772.1 hypothetical protein CEW88_19005 [Alloyangia pacifica]